MTKTAGIRVRVEPGHLEEIRAAARNAGVTLSAWAVERLLRSARRELTQWA